MKNQKSFLKTNWSIIVLAITVIVLVGVYFFTHQSENKVTEATDTITIEGNSPWIFSHPSVPEDIKTTFHIFLDGFEPPLHCTGIKNANGYNYVILNYSELAVKFVDDKKAISSNPFGITADRKIFAKVSFLKKYGMVSFAEVRCEATAWKLEKMTADVIDGEEALVFQLK